MKNRRFTIIKSNTSLDNWKDINESVRNIDVVRNYISWLYNTYPEVIHYNNMPTLDNEDKRELEERSQSESNQFWERLEDNFPDYKWKKRKTDIDDMINMFCIENWYEEKEFSKYFWTNSKYPNKKIRIWENTYYWVYIKEH